jgi:competence protein ComEC
MNEDLLSPVTLTLERLLPEPHSSLLNGILLGREVGDTGTLYTDLRRVGLLHIAVLSGTNVNLIMGAVLALAPRIGRWPATVAAIITIVYFVAIVGPDPPLTRAAVTGILSALGLALGRKPVAWYLLLICAVGTAVFRPEWVSTLSFRLSYAATTGLILFAKPPSVVMDGIGTSGKLTHFIRSELRATCAAQAFAVPIIWWEFREISIISPLANLAVGWTIGPIMILGSATLIADAVLPGLAYVPAALVYGLLSYLIMTVRILSAIPWAFIGGNSR